VATMSQPTGCRRLDRPRPSHARPPGRRPPGHRRRGPGPAIGLVHGMWPSRRRPRRRRRYGPGPQADLRIRLSYLPQPIDVATFVGLRVSEEAFHGWDVRSRVRGLADALPAGRGDDDRPLGRVPRVLRPGRCRRWAPDRRRRREPPTRPARSGPPSPTRCRSPTPATRPDVTLRLPAEAWLRLTYGRLAPEHTPGGVTITGDGVSLDDSDRTSPDSEADHRPVWPKPPSPRSDDGSSATSTKVASSTRCTTSWAMRSPRWTM